MREIYVNGFMVQIWIQHEQNTTTALEALEEAARELKAEILREKGRLEK